MATGLSVTDGFDAFRAFIVAFARSSGGWEIGQHPTMAPDQVPSTFIAYCNLPFLTHIHSIFHVISNVSNHRDSRLSARQGCTSIILECIVELAQCRAIASPRRACCSTVRPSTSSLYPIACCSNIPSSDAPRRLHFQDCGGSRLKSSQIRDEARLGNQQRTVIFFSARHQTSRQARRSNIAAWTRPFTLAPSRLRPCAASESAPPARPPSWPKFPECSPQNAPPFDVHEPADCTPHQALTHATALLPRKQTWRLRGKVRTTLHAVGGSMTRTRASRWSQSWQKTRRATFQCPATWTKMPTPTTAT